MNTTVKTFACLLVAATTFATAPTLAGVSIEGMRSTLFESADIALEKAESANASILAPTSFNAAATLYRKAETRLAKAGSVETIRRDLSKARALFIQSATAAKVAQAALESTIQARDDALSSDAPSYAPAAWQAADKEFGLATTRLEGGKIKYAQKYAAKAETGFRAAELEAIKANYLNETKLLLEKADSLRAKRYAPTSFARATQLLEIAETELTTERYDTDRPRSLAAEAKHNAKHAIYVSKLEQEIKSRGTTLEKELLEWEASMRRLGAVLDTPIYFDDGETQATDTLLEAIETLQSERDQLAQELNDTGAQVTALNLQVTALQERLGGETETIEELGNLIAKQQLHRQRFATVESMFEEHEADVLRKGDDVIIRMVGLNFDSGVATLKSDHIALLSTLQDAIAVFEESVVDVEGHTDAFGSDAQNLVLSQARAEAVVHYLATNMPEVATKLNSTGYGESHPVANNETSDGRTRNRRIDVVIRPNW